MGFESVRSSIAAYFTDQLPVMPAVATVTAAPPPLTPAGVFVGATDLQGAGLFLWLSDANTELIAIPSTYDQQYTLSLILLVLDVEGDAVAAQNLMDQAIDQVTQAIMASRTANDPTVIFEWGLGQRVSGSQDITVTMDLPTIVGTTNVEIRARIDVLVHQLTQNDP